MPTAPEWLRNEWMTDEDPGGDQSAMKYLRDRGYKLGRDWCWDKPAPDYEVTKKEDSALLFLIHEWDFGGLR